MGSLTSPREVKALMEKYGFQFSKRLGQNFLIDENILKKILQGAEVCRNDYVLEIGPGIGTMTEALAKSAGQVVSVEIDSALIPILQDTVGHYPNVKIIHGDILDIDLDNLVNVEFEGKPFKVVANLPYYITTAIIMGLLEKKLPFQSITVMIQKEVAERMAAKPGTKDYGSLSVAVQYYTRTSLVAKAPASVFMPPPKVDSMVIRMDRLQTPSVEVQDESLFFSVVKAAFANRRKTLLNNLSTYPVLGLSKDKALQVLEQCGISPQRRGETLSIEEFALLSDSILQTMDVIVN